MNGSIDYLRALRRNALIALTVTVLALVTTYMVGRSQENVYEAASHLVVIPATSTITPSDLIRSVDTLERRTIVATFARIASTFEVRNTAAEAMQLPQAQISRYTTRGTVVPNTNIIRVSASGPDPVRVAAMANAAAQVTAEKSQEFYRVYALNVLSRATAPTEPAYPDRRRNMLVGVVLALFLGVISALLADRLRGRHVAATATPLEASTVVTEPPSASVELLPQLVDAAGGPGVAERDATDERKDRKGRRR